MINKIMTIAECRAEINKIQDGDVKDVIFKSSWDEDDFLVGASEIYNYLNNVLIIIFMYLYGRYLAWKKAHPNAIEENRDLKKSSNFMRIVTTFEKLYSSFSLSYDLIENLLSDIQIMLNSRDSFIYTKELGIEGDFSILSDFSSCLKLCREGRSLRSQSGDAAYLRRKLVDFLSMAPFLTNIDIEQSPFSFNDSDLVIRRKDGTIANIERLNVKKTNIFGDNSEMNTSYAFIYDRDRRAYYYLHSTEIKEFVDENNVTNTCLILAYNMVGVFSNKGGSDTKVYLIVQNDPSTPVDIENYCYLDSSIDPLTFKKMYFGIEEKRSVSHFIKDFNAINFRYIRILSLALSDILNDDSKRVIYDVYSRRSEYRKMFNLSSENVDDLLNNDGLEEEGYGWDVVIAVILIGESAKKFLYVLFEGHSNRFDELLANLEFRFGKDAIDKQRLIKLSYDEMANAKNTTFKEAYGDPGHVTFRAKSVNSEHILAKIQATIIVNTLSEITFSNENEKKRLIFPLSIHSRIRIIDEISHEDRVYEGERVEALRSLVTQTLKTFYVFYKGLFEYGKIKLDFEKESLVRIFKQSEIDSISSAAITKFKNAVEVASKELSRIKDNDVAGVMQVIKRFNRICSYPGQHDSYNELLHALLGREYLVRYRGIEVLENCFERYDQHGPDYDFQDLCEQVRKAMDYLRTGELDRHLSEGHHVIFPLVVFMDYTSKTRDGYDIYHCSSSNNDVGHESDYRVISEFNYPVNVSYYCIPNTSRSNDDMMLWIEPILIDSNLIQEANFNYTEESNES